MSMTMFGCQGRDHTPSLVVKTCPQCGYEIELFSTDVSVACDQCGYTVYNDATSCAQWCRYARQCVGDEEYERLMEIAERQASTGSDAEQ